MIKNIKFELAIILILILNIFITSTQEIKIYKKISSLDFNLSNKHLNIFFNNITEIGNSFWFFSISILGYLVCFFLEKKINKVVISKIKDACLFLFVALLITGTLTQIVKHLVGRPRPNYSNHADALGINFFSIESSFHSFPSGHTSTIFIVAIVLYCLTPKIKYFYLFFAFLTAFSRVVVGAHYFSDVLGGIAISFIGFKLTLYLFHKINKEKNILTKINFNLDLFFLTFVVFLISIIFLTVGSSIDIFISDLFYRGGQVFTLQSFSLMTILAREIFLPFVVLYILILPIISLYLPLNKIYFGFDFDFKKIIFLWLSFIFNLVVIVNILLKGFWGRARPNDILELGGKDFFTPWYEISSACNSNCSFVSGDASVGFSLIGLFFLTKNKIFFWLALFSGLFLGLIRILEGGHFLSDIVIAGFIILFLSYIQSITCKKMFKNVL